MIIDRRDTIKKDGKIFYECEECGYKELEPEVSMCPNCGHSIIWMFREAKGEDNE